MTEGPGRDLRHLLAALTLFAAGVTSGLICLLTGIAALATAWSFALLGLLGVAACGALGALVWTAYPERRRRAAAALLLTVLPALACLAPWPTREREARVRSITLEGTPCAAPWFGGLPELHVVRGGGHVGALAPERRWFREGLFEQAYGRIATEGLVDPSTSWTLDAWLHDRRHLWLAVPDGPGPHPLVVFLHGSGGPFQWYPHALAPVALARKAAIALPSWGFGVWTTPDGRRRILETVDAVRRLHPIDPKRIYLAGLSNGGIGAADLFGRDPGPFAACAAISGVWPELPPGASRPPYAGRPLHLLHGAVDARLPAGYPRRLAEVVKDAGGTVTYEEVPDGDHFILLTHAERLGPLFDRLLQARLP